MYTPKENFIRTVNKDNPDRLVNDYEAFTVIRNDPITDLDRGIRIQGRKSKTSTVRQSSGRKNQPGGMPHVTEENKVIKDITNWRNELKLPDYAAMDLDWTLNAEMVAQVDRNEKLVTSIMATGLF